MTDQPKKSVSGVVIMRCERCQFNVWRPTYWKKYECPVCHEEMVVHVERKEVNDGEEKKPIEST